MNDDQCVIISQKEYNDLREAASNVEKYDKLVEINDSLRDNYYRIEKSNKNLN